MLHFPKKKSSRFFVIVCGRGYGKTFAAAKEASFVASMPDKKVALVGLSYKKSKLLFDEIWRTMVIPNKASVVKSSEKDQYVRFKWGSSIEGLSADNPDSLVGDEYDLVVMDEAAKMRQDIWDMYISPAVGLDLGGGVFYERIGFVADCYNHAVRRHCVFAAFNRHRPPSPGIIRFAKFIAQAGDGLDSSVFIAFSLNGVFEEMKLYALFFGVGDLAQTPFRAIACHRIAELLRAGETHADQIGGDRLVFAALARLQQKAGHPLTLRRGRFQEIRPLPQNRGRTSRII